MSTAASRHRPSLKGDFDIDANLAVSENPQPSSRGNSPSKEPVDSKTMKRRLPPVDMSKRRPPSSGKKDRKKKGHNRRPDDHDYIDRSLSGRRVTINDPSALGRRLSAPPPPPPLAKLSQRELQNPALRLGLGTPDKKLGSSVHVSSPRAGVSIGGPKSPRYLSPRGSLSSRGSRRHLLADSDNGQWKRLKDKLLQVTRTKAVTHVMARRVSAAAASHKYGEDVTDTRGTRSAIYKTFSSSSGADVPTKKVFAQMPLVLEQLEQREIRERAMQASEALAKQRKSARGSTARGSKHFAFGGDSTASPGGGGGESEARRSRFKSKILSVAAFASGHHDDDFASAGSFGGFGTSSGVFKFGESSAGFDDDEQEWGDVDDTGIEVFSNASDDSLLQIDDNPREDAELMRQASPFARRSSSVVSPLISPGDSGNVQKRRYSGVSEVTEHLDHFAKRQALMTPSYKDMEHFVPAIRNGITSRATKTLMLRLYPMMILRARRKQQRALTQQASVGAVMLKPEIIKKCGGIFRQWNDAALSRLAQGARYITADNGEMVVYSGEPHRAGLYFFTAGSAYIHDTVTDGRRGRGALGKAKAKFGLRGRRSTIKTGGDATKSDSSKDAVQSVTLKDGTVITPPTQYTSGMNQGPFCIGESLPLTEERHRYDIRAVTKCDIWNVTTEAFHEALALVSGTTRGLSIQSCFHEKNELLQRTAMTPLTLRQYRMFTFCADGVLADMCRHIVPYCVPRGHNLSVSGEPPTMIVFVLSGRCAIKRRVKGELLHVANMNGGGVVGDTNVLHNRKHRLTVTTTTRCDCWALPKSKFDTVASMSPQITESIMLSFREARREQIAQHLVTFRDKMINFPLLDHAVSVFMLRDMVRLFQPKVYKAMSVLCSTAAYCDRVILLLKGRVSVGIDGQWPVGEINGFSGIVEHRWAQPVVCQTTVETLEIGMDMFEAYLRDAKVFDKMRLWCQHLMFPKAFPPEDVTKSVALVRKHHSTPLYPISTSRKVHIPMLRKPMMEGKKLAALQREAREMAEHGTDGEDSDADGRRASVSSVGSVLSTNGVFTFHDESGGLSGRSRTPQLQKSSARRGKHGKRKPVSSLLPQAEDLPPRSKTSIDGMTRVSKTTFMRRFKTY